jgi:hypothetical protein
MVSPNAALGVASYRRAADQGHADGMIAYRECLLNGAGGIEIWPSPLAFSGLSPSVEIQMGLSGWLTVRNSGLVFLSMKRNPQGSIVRPRTMDMRWQ